MSGSSPFRFTRLSALALAALTAAACDRPPDLPFAESPGDPPDFAAIERDHPLTREHRMALTPDNLAGYNQSQLDQIYARLKAGPIPDGPYRGTIIFAAGGGPKKLSERLGPIAEGVVDLKLTKLDLLGEALWKGKVFFKSERLLRNMIDHEQVVQRIFDFDPAQLIKRQVGDREVALLFPAELYCGDSLLDPRRDSVIIDYANTEQLPGYIPEVDSIAGRDKLRVRDEIRMISPGLYLGRAYLREKFALTFTLKNDEVAAAGVWPEEECWDGSGPKPAPAVEEATEPPEAPAPPESGETGGADPAGG